MCCQKVVCISSLVRLSMASFLHLNSRKQCQICLWCFNKLQYLKLTSLGSGPSSRVAGQLGALTQSAGQHGSRGKFLAWSTILQACSRQLANNSLPQAPCCYNFEQVGPLLPIFVTETKSLRPIALSATKGLKFLSEKSTLPQKVSISHNDHL